MLDWGCHELGRYVCVATCSAYRNLMGKWPFGTRRQRQKCIVEWCNDRMKLRRRWKWLRVGIAGFVWCQRWRTLRFSHRRVTLLACSLLIDTVFFSWTLSVVCRFFRHWNTTFQKPGLLPSSSKMRLTCWTPQIELFSVTGYYRNTRLV